MRRGHPGQVWAVLLLFAFVLGAGGAAAQDAEDADAEAARARELFSEALTLADAGDWSRAVHRFRSALEHHDAPTIRFNLASSLSQLGRITEALAELDRVDADGEVDERLRDASSALRAEIEPRLGRLIIVVTGDSTGTYVTVDGQRWEAGARASPTDPGIRVIRLFRGAEELTHTETDVPDGGESRVILEVPGTRVEVLPTQALLQPTDSEDEGGDDGLLFGLAIGGVAMAIAAAVLIGFMVVDPSEPMSSMGDFFPPLIRID